MTAHNETFNSPNPSAGPKMAQDMIRWYDQARLFCIEALEALKFLLEQGMAKSWLRAKEEFKFLSQNFSAIDFIFGNLTLALLGFSGLLVVAGFSIFGYQGFLWLQNGVWDPMSMMMVFNFLFEGTALHGWMVAPESWLGLHQIVEWVLTVSPVSLVLVVNGLLLGMVTTGVSVLALMIRRFQLRLTDQH